MREFLSPLVSLKFLGIWGNWGKFGTIQENSGEFSMALSRNSVGIPGNFGATPGFPGNLGLGSFRAIWSLERLLCKQPFGDPDLNLQY